MITNSYEYEQGVAGPLARLGQPAYCPQCAGPWTTVERRVPAHRTGPLSAAYRLTCMNGHLLRFRGDAALGEDQ